MPLPFHEQLKNAREESLYPNQTDFARYVHLSKGGYRKMETGERLPSFNTLADLLSHQFFSEATNESLMKAWYVAKAKQAGIPAASGPIDISRMCTHLERELTVILRRYATESVHAHSMVTRTFKKRAEIVLRTALET